MDRHEAVDLATAVDAVLGLPVHVDTFEAIETDSAAFSASGRSRGIWTELPCVHRFRDV